MSYIYLASPYTHPAATVREARFSLCMTAVAEIARAGLPVYSPIVHWHPVADAWGMPKGVDFWWPQNRALIIPCVELWVYLIPGWEQSNGVLMEVTEARERKIPVRYAHEFDALIEQFKTNHPSLVGVSK